MTNVAHALYQRHKALLERALDACRYRHAWSAFRESPSSRIHGTEAPRRGHDDFQAQLGRPFDLDQPGTTGRVGREISPYTSEPLGIDYPNPDCDALFGAARGAMAAWNALSPEDRAGVCLEMAAACDRQNFANAQATMHTAGQAFVMAFSGSGANALDRGVEAVAYAYKALCDVPQTAHWEKAFGAAGPVALAKRFRLMPRGPAVVICCATFPLWNAYPAVFANLMTGNPAIVKPHPNGILPVAMAVRAMRGVLRDAGLDPNLVLLAPDSADAPVTKHLLEHADCAIVDYTGSQRFGAWIEMHCPGRLVYTETSGCNGVVIESSDDFDGMIRGLAISLCGFSAQMCTSPQNIHIPAGGIDVDGRNVSYRHVVEALVGAVDDATREPQRAAAICGAIQAPTTLALIDRLRGAAGAGVRILRDSAPYLHPDFPHARTATPLLLEVSPDREMLFSEEQFGPIGFVIREPDAEAALARASRLARDCGAISSYLYSVNEAFLERAQDAFAAAGASLWCNMTTAMPINFAAAYSDYHVTGMNPAGNACLTDLAFVANRFRIVQFRWPTGLSGAATPAEDMPTG